MIEYTINIAKRFLAFCFSLTVTLMREFDVNFEGFYSNHEFLIILNYFKQTYVINFVATCHTPSPNPKKIKTKNATFVVNLSRKFLFHLPFNSFRAIGLFLYPPKTSQTLWFSDVFRGYRKRPVAWDGLIENTLYFSLINERIFSN